MSVKFYFQKMLWPKRIYTKNIVATESRNSFMYLEKAEETQEE